MAIETNELIDVKTLKPFKRFIMTIGNLPTSYLESMTYGEMLMWFCNYLQETVIPTVNNNGLAVEELQNFVTEYFDNLDVTEEIENKLDEMASDGTLTNLIKNYCDPLINAQNTEISNIRNIVTNVASGSPLIASSTSGMTDTSRIYVNTTDGKWYYYDGDSWEIGGTYQSSGISNKSIDVYMLDDLLQSNFTIMYSTPLSLGSEYAGFYKYDGTYVDNDTYSNFHYNLVNGKTYVFTGNNLSQISAIVIMDNSNNVIYASNTSANLSNTTSTIFKCKENNLTAYISYNPANTFVNKFLMLRELNGVYNELKYTNNIPVVYEHDGFLLASNLASNSIQFNDADSNGHYKIYQMNNGRSYFIDAWNYSNICGLLILDLNRNILYASSTSNIGSTRTEFTKSYTATTDGFIVLTTYQPAQMPTSINVVNDNIEIINSDLNIYGKKLTVNGDSICKGDGYNGGYAKIIGDKYNMTVQNVAQNGATITSGTQASGVNRHWINATISDMASDSDYAIVEGGVNDSSLSVTLGSLSNGFDAELDVTTYYGAFENMLKQLINRFKGKKYGYIAVHQMTANYRVINDPATSYYWASKKCCEKWGVPFLDLNIAVPPFAFLVNTSLSDLPENYTKNGDGWHPNEEGYKKYYVDKIVSWLNTL